MADIGTAYVRVAPNMQGIQSKIASGFKGSGTAFANQFGGEISSKSAAIAGAIAGVASAAVNKGMSLISNSIGTAIKRVDTLANAQKTFQYMGFAADDAAAATKAVTKSILGLPTPLDSAIRGMTSLAATYGNVKLGQKVFTALNDAILGFGGSAEMVDNAIQQVSQLPLDGPLDAQTWMSLRNSGLTPVLVAMGKDMGRSVSKLKEDFGSGKLTVQDFVNELTKLDTKGGGGLVSLQKIAQNATSGIGTGFANMQTAVARGIANIIQAVGQKNISNAISAIGKAFEQALNSIAKAVPIIIGKIKGFFEFIARNKDIFAPLAVGAAAAATAMIALAVASKIAAGISALQGAVKAAQLAMFTYNVALEQGATAMQAFNIATGANPLSIIIVSLAAVTAALVYFFTKTDTGRKIFASVTAFIASAWGKVKDAIKAVADFLNTAWDAASSAFSKAFNAIKSTADTVFGAIIKWLHDWRYWIQNISIIIGTILLPKIIAIGIQWIKTAAQATGSFVKTAASAIKNAVVASAAWIKNAVLASAAWLKEMPKLVLQFIQTSAASIKNAVIASAAWIQNAVLVSAAWIKNLILMGLQFAWTGVQALIAAGKVAASWLLALGPIGLIVAAVVGAAALIVANWNKIGPFFAGIWNGIKNIIAGVINWIKANWPLILAIIAGPIGLAVAVVIKNWQKIKDGASSMLNAVVGFFRSLPGRILGALGNLGSLLYNSGKSLIQGLLNGAGSLLSKIGEYFLNVIPGWIRGPFKKALGIHSPSTVFAGFGKNIVQGLAVGVDKSSGIATNSVNNMANDVMSAMTGSVVDPNMSLNYNTPASAGAASGNTTTNTTTIQQVVLGDQSAVKEFFKQLNQDTISVGMGLTPVQGARP